MNRVLIKKSEPIVKTKGGILLPEKNQEQLNFGVVIAVGPGRTLDNGSVRAVTVKEGDTVLLPEYGGNKVTLGDNQEYFLYRDDDLMGTLHDPTKWKEIICFISNSLLFCILYLHSFYVYLFLFNLLFRASLINQASL